MSGRYMTDGEICASYRQALDQRTQIFILAELNDVDTDVIRRILTDAGYDTTKARTMYREDVVRARTKRRKWTEEDIRLAVEMRSGGHSAAEIAECMGRTEDAVYATLTILRRKGYEIKSRGKRYMRAGRNT